MSLSLIQSKAQAEGLIPLLEDLLLQAKNGRLKSVIYVGLATDGDVMWGRSNELRDNVAIVGAAAILQKRCLDLIETEERSY